MFSTLLVIAVEPFSIVPVGNQIADYALPVDGEFGAAERRRTTGNVLATCHVAAMSSIAVAERHRREIRGTPVARVR